MSERAGRWFVALQVEMAIPDPEPPGKGVAGVDLGVLPTTSVSDGRCVENPRALKQGLTKLRRLQRRSSRRQNGSANRKKAVQQLAQAHLQVANSRKDALHQAASRLAKTRSAIVLEDLNVSGMLKNHCLAPAIADAGLSEFRRQLGDKGKGSGCEVLIADRDYPSSKRCSRCGQLKPDLALNEREDHCQYCGLVMDRDLNAAINLEQLLHP